MKKKKDESLIKKLLDSMKKKKQENEELKKLKDLKKRIKEIKTLYADYNVRIQTIDDSLGETFELTYFNTNIENYISDNIPEYLSEKYELIKDKVKNKPVY